MAVPSGAIESGTCGTCTWYITSTGELVVEPTSGSTGYIVKDWLSYPWTGKKTIVTATIKPGVTIKTKASSDLFQYDHSLMFSGCSNLVSVTAPAEFWDTNANSFYSTFQNCVSLKRVNFNGATLASAKNFNSMFCFCRALESLDLSSINTSNVTTMEQMFYDCQQLASVNLSGWDVSKVVSFDTTFCSCKSLVSLDISGWATSAATNFSDMFSGCSALTSISMPLLDGTNVTSTAGMFNGCSALRSLSLSQTTFPALTDVRSMFNGCVSLEYLDVSTMDLSGVSEDDRYNMLGYGNASLTRVKVGSHFVATNTELINEGAYKTFKTITSESNEIELSSSAAFDKLTAEERAGVWSRKTTVSAFSVSAYRVDGGQPDEDGPDSLVRINWSTDATTIDRTLSIYKKLSTDPSYPATPAYTEELVGDTGVLVGDTGVKVVTFSDVGDYAYDFRVEFYDGTNTFIAFPSIASNIRLMVFDKDGNAELLKVLTADDYKLKLDNYSDLTSVDGKIFQAITALGWTGVIIDE